MPIKNTTTIDDVITLLNQALHADQHAISTLFLRRVNCNKALADHPTIQVSREQPEKDIILYQVGVIGIINGMFGVDDRDSYGPIAAYIKDGRILRFVRIK